MTQAIGFAFSKQQTAQHSRDALVSPMRAALSVAHEVDAEHSALNKKCMPADGLSGS